MGNRQVILAQRPIGMVDETTTSVIESPMPVCGPGEALVKVGLLSIDPTIRTWMNDAPGYLPPIGIGDVIRAGGSGVVVESNSERYQVGDVVNGMTGWQEWAIASEANRFTVLPKGLGLDLATVMNVLGATGLTAYFGLLDVGAFKEGDVVVVSGAAGATGSVAGQIAKIKGAKKVIGIAGGPEKCNWLVEDLGYDGAIDYKSENVRHALREKAGEIDLYFDNVGGEILEAVLANLAKRARIVLCGAISQYNAEGERRGPANYAMLIARRAGMQGFLILDYGARFGEAQAELGKWVAEGRVKSTQHVVEGLEHTPDALNLLFTGGNTGKVMVKVA